MKEFAYELSFPLTEICNCSILEGVVPDMWKMAYIEAPGVQIDE